MFERPQAQRPVTGRMVLCWMVGFFAIIAAVNAMMITLAVSTFGGVETESSYKAGRLFAREVAAAREQNARNWQVTASVRPESDGRQRVELAARDADGRPIGRLAGSIRLSHPADRRADRTGFIEETGAGHYVSRLDAPPGQWHLVIELLKDGERIFYSKSRVVTQ